MHLNVRMNLTSASGYELFFFSVGAKKKKKKVSVEVKNNLPALNSTSI